MWYLYVDESGDLGFDFITKSPSKFFTLTILALGSYEQDRKLAKVVKLTLTRKLNPRNKRKRIVQELKGADTTLKIKKYFYKQLREAKFWLYSITINKRRVVQELAGQKERLYNYIARKVLDHIPLEKSGNNAINLIVDKCKGKPEVKEFNNYIRRQLEARINPQTPLYINHSVSQEAAGLQACDMFCWGIFQKYERRKTEWFDIFASERIRFDELYFNRQ